MKLLITFIMGMIALYFGADFLLAKHFKSTVPSTFAGEKNLVQNMARFLEQSPDLQKKIRESGQSASTTNPDQTAGSDLSRYFGSSPSDQFFHNYISRKLLMNPDDADEITRASLEASTFIHEHPKEAVESLENALQSIPQDMKAEREAIVPTFIHASITFIEESSSMDESTKRAYLKRFIANTQSADVKEALESHFPDLLEN